jgi:hypothetical protein
MYYIPSLQIPFDLKPITIGVLKKIIKTHSKYPTLNIGFNYEFINYLLQNTDKQFNLTSFDKHCLGLQIHYKDILSINKQNNFKKLPEHIVETDIFKIVLQSPFIKEEKKYYHALMSRDDLDRDTLLLTEISKYVDRITVNKININFNTLTEKINTIKKLPTSILGECVRCIDKIKQDTLIQCDNKDFDISLLIG